MDKVRPYEPDPVIPPNDVKLSDFTFKLIQVQTGDDPNAKVFTDKYKVKIPASIRGRYLEDIMFADDWKGLLVDFDRKFPSYR